MTMPKPSHIKNRVQVCCGKNAINAPQESIPNAGNSGLKGFLNGRFNLGCVLLKTMTPKHTKTNAAKVPIFTSSASAPSGIRPAATDIMTPVIAITRTGVWVLGLTFAR